MASGAEAGGTIDFAIYGPIARSDLPGLCDRVCALLEQTTPLIARCDVQGVPADAVSIDALARLQLAAGRYGCQVQLRNASADLRGLLLFLGLPNVLPLEATTPGAPAGRTAGTPGPSTGRT